MLQRKLMRASTTMRLKNYTPFVPMIILVLSCTYPKSGENPLNLEAFDLDFAVDRFYSAELEKEKQYNAQREEILNGKDEKDFGDKLIDPWSFETIAIDSVFVDNIFAPSKQLVGLQYNMKSWTHGDTLAQYGKMYFEAIHMMRSVDGKFMALVASNQSDDEVPFKQLLAEIEKEHGEAKRTEHNFSGDYYIYSWQLKDLLLAISSKYNDKSNELKLALDLDSMKADTTKQPSTDSKLFIVSNTFRDSIAGNLKSGPWLYFDDLLEK